MKNDNKYYVQRLGLFFAQVECQLGIVRLLPKSLLFLGVWIFLGPLQYGCKWGARCE